VSPLDVEIRSELVATAPRAGHSGEAYRHMAARWDDPLSGEGARIRGGRFNPPDSYPVLYLCTTRPCTVAELHQLARRQTFGVDGLLPRVVYRYEITLDDVLDLTVSETLDHLGITAEQVTGADLAVPRQIGESAHAVGLQAIKAPSATGVDSVIAVFPELIGGGRLVPQLLERWDSSEDL
jgi:RES domain-containing protein